MPGGIHVDIAVVDTALSEAVSSLKRRCLVSVSGGGGAFLNVISFLLVSMKYKDFL